MSKVILTAKKLHYNKLILSSRDMMKCTWKIINEEKGATKNGMDIQSLVIDNNIITNQNKIASTLNNYFLSIADSINTDINKHIRSDRFNPNYLFIKQFQKTHLKNKSAVCIHLRNQKSY